MDGRASGFGSSGGAWANIFATFSRTVARNMTFKRSRGRGGGARGGRGRGGRGRRSARDARLRAAWVGAGARARQQQWASLGVAFVDLLSPDAADSLLPCERAGASLHVGGRTLAVQRVVEHRRAPEGLLHAATVHVGFIQRPCELAVTWQSKAKECRVEFDVLDRKVRVLVGGGMKDVRLQHRLEWRMRDVRLWAAPHRAAAAHRLSARRPPSLLLLPTVPPAVFSRLCDDDVWEYNPSAFPDDSDPWTRTTDHRLAPTALPGGGSRVGWESGEQVREIAERMRTAGLCRTARHLGQPHRTVIASFFRPQPPISIAPFVCLHPCWPSTTSATTANTTSAGTSSSSSGRTGVQAAVLAFPVLYVLTLLVQAGTIPLSAVSAPLYSALVREPARAAVAVLLEFTRFSRPEFDPAGVDIRRGHAVCAMRRQGKLPGRDSRAEEGAGGQARGAASEGARMRRREEAAQGQGKVEERRERHEEEEDGQARRPQQGAESAAEQSKSESKSESESESESEAWPWALPENHVLVSRLLVTPLAALCCLPSVELANRVLSHYRPHAHRFLRVTFTEEGVRHLASFALVGAAYRAEEAEAEHSARTDVYRRILRLVNKVWGSRRRGFGAAGELVAQGFELCGRGYRFLASSASQLREKSAWFLTEEPHLGLTVTSMQAWMGTFTTIRNVAKCAARMGQCFSSRFTSLRALVRTLPDSPGAGRGMRSHGEGRGGVAACAVGVSDPVRGGEGGGGGVATWGDAAGGGAGGQRARHRTCCWRQGQQQQQQQQQQQKVEEEEAAVDMWFRKGQCADAWWAQARQGGWGDGEAGRGRAGVVHMWVRESMDKFESQHAHVEVVNWMRPQAGFLNRQIVTLLSTLGFPDLVFLDMQMVKRLKAAVGSTGTVRHLKSRPSTHPSTSPHTPYPIPTPRSPPPRGRTRRWGGWRQRWGSGEAALQLLEESGVDHLYDTAITMLRAGFHPAQEPHLKRMIQSVRALQLQGLISRARIFVRDGRWLMGVVDETGLLQYGQCFIQVCDATAPTPGATFRLQSTSCGMGPPRVVRGPVVSGKNPCLHQGDLRLLTAVDVPCLHHLIDCLVLPKNGPHPHANEASGSDMDGDVYFVTWDPRLLPPGGESSEPMDYQPNKKDGDAAVTMQDVHRFFVDHMLNDSVGIICNAHVVHTDRSPLGAFDPACLTLARQAALAFDFPKTGVPGVMPRDLRVYEYPDFMEKDERQDTYESSKVLGQLYRRVKRLVLGHEADDTPRVIPAVEEEEEEGEEGEGSDEEVEAEMQQGGNGGREGGGRGWEGEADMMADRRTWLWWPGADEVGRAYRADLRAEGFERHVEEARWLKLEYDRSMLHILHQGRREEVVEEHVRNMFLSLHHHYHRLLVNGVEGRGEDNVGAGGEDGEEGHRDSFMAPRFPQQQRSDQRQPVGSQEDSHAGQVDLQMWP
ncbi:unnamed protein product [Closterium sp. Naga37s-1]|nr:unnamed protein product [Closterium sp. Naga37s-1]